MLSCFNSQVIATVSHTSVAVQTRNMKSTAFIPVSCSTTTTNNKQQTSRKPREKSINMNDSTDLQYPNLTTCRVVLCATPGMDKPPVRLPRECLQAAESFRLPPIYDFEVGTYVLGGGGGGGGSVHDRMSGFILFSAIFLTLPPCCCCCYCWFAQKIECWRRTTSIQIRRRMM